MVSWLLFSPNNSIKTKIGGDWALFFGLVSFSTRYTPSGNYLSGFKGYDGAGRPTGIILSIPTSETGLSGLYTTTFGWTSTGLQTFVTPAAGGGLPAEIVRTSHTKLGHPLSTAGYNDYVDTTTYTPFGEPQQFSLGVLGSTAWLTYDRDAQTRRVTSVNLSGHTASPLIDNTAYTYDPVGNITRSVDTQGDTGLVQTTCYRYDALDRLTEAWAATDNCAGAPSTAAGSANIGGANPFWTTWGFDPSGLRTSQVQHALPGQTGGDTTTTYSYGRTDGSQPDTLTGTSTTGPAGTSPTGYGFDAAGNTTSRDVPGGSQTLSWDAENRLTGYTTPTGSGSYVYDADGNQLIRRDPGSTTLFLPGEELTRTSDGTVTGTRYYSHGGVTVGLRVGGGNPTWVLGDQHGTTQLAVNVLTDAVVRRSFDPYGNPLGATTGGTWPDSHGFLNKPTNAVTGLTDVGARKYDPVTGVFISPDPVLNAADPGSLNGYTYADGNPVLNTDPTGLTPCSKLPAEDRYNCEGPGERKGTAGGGTHSSGGGGNNDKGGSGNKSEYQGAAITGDEGTDSNQLSPEIAIVTRDGKLKVVPNPQYWGTLGIASVTIVECNWICATSEVLEVAGLVAPFLRIPALVGEFATRATGSGRKVITSSTIKGGKQFSSRVGGLGKFGDAEHNAAGSELRSVEDVMVNPQLLAGRSPEEVDAIIGNTPGWQVGTLRKGRSSGSGWTMRELNSRGNDHTDRYIQWHPGSPRHFDGRPYWKVSNGRIGTIRIPQWIET